MLDTLTRGRLSEELDDDSDIPDDLRLLTMPRESKKNVSEVRVNHFQSISSSLRYFLASFLLLSIFEWATPGEYNDSKVD